MEDFWSNLKIIRLNPSGPLRDLLGSTQRTISVYYCLLLSVGVFLCLFGVCLVSVSGCSCVLAPGRVCERQLVSVGVY